MRNLFSAERWQAVSAQLDRALELDGEERAAWLATLRAEDPALAADVESVLAAQGALEREGFLAGAPPPRPPQASLSGQSVGAYTLRSLIGQGGMGSVWLAERSDGRFQGVAAVKLLNAGLVGRGGEARFRREGNILARLQHRNIAHLIDAGLAPWGQPYLVLERVDGRHIDRYCDEQRLGVAARLRLFLEVLEAVAHAHAKLIVHRDLKPSNVLVGQNGQVKLLDFGIAKLLEAEPGDGDAVGPTRDGEAALTPEYAAPEQLSGGHVTTATDVYALGVLLYVLLSGRHPAGTAARTPAELVKAIVDTEALRVSDAVGASRPAGESAASVAERRATTPARLRAALRGDLDNIVARALEKPAERRYASVEAMADDLRRHLRHQPVSARPGSLAYRAAKFVRRNRSGVAAAALVVAAVLSGTVGVAWQAREAQRQRDAAQAQLARATAANDFMAFLLSVAAPAGRQFSVGELLEQSEALIDKQFGANDPLRAEMLVAVGQQYMASERWDRATPVLERAAEIAGRSDDVGLRARALCPLALLRMFHGERPPAAALMERALAELGDDPQYALQRAECLSSRSAFGYFTGEAEPMIRNATAAIELLDAIDVPSAWKRTDAEASLAYGYYLARRNREADATWAQVMAELERTGRGRTLAAADALNNWALVHYQGDIARAEPLQRRCVELRRAIESGGSVAPTVTFNYAGLLLRLARYDEAERLFEETIRSARARQERRIEIDAMMELVELYAESGELERAGAQLAKLAPYVRDQRFDEWRRVQLAYYEGRLALARGDHAQARRRLAEAVETFARRRSKIAMNVLALVGLARAEQALGSGTVAAAAAREAVALAESFVEREAPSYLVGLSRQALGEIQLANGEEEAGTASLRVALEHLERTLGPDHPATRGARRRAAS